MSEFSISIILRDWLRIFIALILVVLFLLPYGHLTFASPPNKFGDVDGNGIVDLEDARLVTQYVNGQIQTLPYLENADATNDGKINMEDALAIAQKVVGRSQVVVARTEFGLPGKIYIGSIVRIDVYEQFFPYNVTNGMVRIVSPNTTYDSGNQPLTLEYDGRSLYYRWDTTGLLPASDYGVYVALSGLEITEKPDIVLSLCHRFYEVHRIAEAQDAYAPAPGIVLEFRRTFPHDSLHVPYLGPLGYGWMHNFDIHLREFTDGSIVFIGSNGFNRWFMSNGDGTYTASLGDYGILTRDSDGTFQLIEKKGFIYRFRSDLRLDYLQDPNGNRVTCIYNKDNQLIQLMHSNGLSIHLEYNMEGRISKLIDHVGRIISYEYSTDGNHLLMVNYPTGEVITYTYSLGLGEASDHRLTSITFPDNTHIYYAYDSEGRLVSRSEDNGVGRINYSYDVNGTTYKIDTDGGVTSVRVNDRGQPIALVNPLGSVTRYEYDMNNNLIKVIGPSNHTYTYNYNERGNIVQITNPLMETIKLGYEPEFNRIAWVQDSLNRIITFSYNNRGNLIAITYPDGTIEKYIYDKNNRLHSKIYRNGNAIDYTFDDNGLLTSKTYPDGTSINYAYDDMGRLTSCVDLISSINLIYDAMDHLISITYNGNRTFQYEYDISGKRTRMIDPDGRILNYQYEGEGRLTRITDDNGQPIVDYHYDNMNRRIYRNLSNGVYTTYEYDLIGRIKQIINYNSTGNIISYFNYTYNIDGDLQYKETIEGIVENVYDAINRLVKVRNCDGTVTEFVYDAMGNRLQITENDVQINYTVNNLNQYPVIGSTIYEYDSNGNLISKCENGQIVYYDYDFENRLLQVRKPRETIKYTYNALGFLNSRTNSNSTVHYLWDGNQLVIEESEKYETLTRYIWGSNFDEIIKMERHDDYYYLQDAILSVSDLMDTYGNQVEHYKYSIFGEPLVTSYFGNPWFFSGSMYDFETGLQYLRHRYYSPSLGRFITADPIGFTSDINLYTYARNNPESFVDPFGTDIEWDEKISVPNPVDPSSTIDIPVPSYEPPSPGVYLPFPLDVPQDIPPSFYTSPQPPPGSKPPDERSGWVWLESAGGWYYAAGICPTFIQLPAYLEVNVGGRTYLNVTQEQLAGKIVVPIEGCLLRSDIPIFGVAGGEDFKEYVVEYGKGINPSTWNVIYSSTIQRPTLSIGLAEMQMMQGDIDIRGNLATWNTGLKEWIHLPWHPPEDPTDLNGVYTLRLLVLGKDGQKVEDRMVVEVGRVIAQCLPGIAISPDNRVVMRFPEHSLTEPFRVYTILPLSEVYEEIPTAPDGIQLTGPIYDIREPGDRFIKDVSLEFNVPNDEMQGRDAKYLGILQYDITTKDWRSLCTSYSYHENITIFSTTLCELPTVRAIYAIGYDPYNVHSQIKVEKKQMEPLSPIRPGILVFDTFEEDVGHWKCRDHFVGAVLNRVRATPSGSHALIIINPAYGGSFAVTVLNRSFDIREYPVMSFDYRIGPGVKTDFYLLVNGRWYNLGFTDDAQNFRNRDVNIANLGRIEGIVADDEWHTASVNLYELLSQKTRNTRVDEIMMADFDVTGYMKLEFGNNIYNVAYYIDNFKITSDSAHNSSDVVVVDTFNSPEVNDLGGMRSTFSSPGTDFCQATVVDDPTATGHNGVLELKFDTPQDGTYCGFLSSLKGIDLGDMREISMRIYSPEQIPTSLLGLRYRPWVETTVPMQLYVSSPDEDGWRIVTIPLSAFNDLQNFSSMDALFISFENEISSGKGMFYVDDIEFHSRPSYGNVVDFDVHDMGNNLLGGGFRIIEKEAAVISTSYHEDTVSSPARGTVRISYGGTIGLDYGGGRFSYAFWETELLGFDAREFRNLILRIRGEKGGEKPNIWLDDGTTRRPVRAKEYAPITSSWQEICIPLDRFASQGVDLSHLEAIQIVFEWEEMSGTIYISEIRFDAGGS